MERMENSDMANRIAAQIAHETRRLNKLRDEGKEVSAEGVSAIGIDDFKESFNTTDAGFLPDELLNKKLGEFEANIYKLKQIFPEGMRVVLAALPCDINGALYSEEDYKNGQYLTVFFVDEKTGLSTGFGALNPTTHAKLLPTEIQEQCSFAVHYESSTPWADKKDFENFAGKFRNAYHELQKLLKI